MRTESEIYNSWLTEQLGRTQSKGHGNETKDELKPSLKEKLIIPWKQKGEDRLKDTGHVAQKINAEKCKNRLNEPGDVLYRL